MSFFTYTDKVTLIDIDNNLKLSKKGILRMLQEAANLASTECGYGISNMNETGKTWVLLYWRIKTLKDAFFTDEITIKTWANFTKNIYSNRSFEVYSNDKLIAIADSKWVFVDSVNHSIQKITDDIIQTYGQEDKKLFDNELNQRVKFSENAVNTLNYTTLKRDLDGNHHVNNIIFYELGIEGLPEGINDNKFSDISIIFKKEIMYKDNVSCFYEKKDLEHFVYIYSTETKTLHGIVIFKEQDN